MTFGQEIEYMRRKRNYSIVDMCNTLGISDSDYMRLINGSYKLDIQQKILLVSAMRHPFESMPKNNKKDR
ncbi:MAG: hypothetical protein IKA08_04620 [Alphaproteobacteria bacterium]|nr:hypothetical protein [Alphaproteobacteria bacterium]